MEIHAKTLTEKGTQISDYKPFFKDYKPLFESWNIPFKLNASHIVVGDFGTASEWLLYISVIKTQLEQAMEIILPMLTAGKIAVGIPENSQIHGSILDGDMGWKEVAKVITIRATDIKQLPYLAKELINVTKALKGPEIPEAKKLGGCLYTEFSSPLFLNESNTEKYDNLDSSWPFDDINPPKSVRSSKWLSKKYLLIDTLKLDPKGNVYKALNLAKWLNIKWCVIKEGKHNQCFDEFNRSIIERLHWQHLIQQKFSEDKILPQVVDFFMLRQNAYLVMEMVSGLSYNEKVSEIQRGILYSTMPNGEKEKLLNLLFQLVYLIEKFHGKGYLHRDISPINFIVRDSGELIAIDVELAYNYIENKPSPWFILGTDGYMSKAQLMLQSPEVTDDIYGLGGMLIRTLTGISPIKFDRLQTPEQLFNHLTYFIEDKRVISLIVQCRDDSSSMRPSLTSIKHTLELAQVKLLTAFKELGNYDIPDLHLKTLVSKTIHGYYERPLIGPDFLWYDKARNNPGKSKVYSFYPDLFNGASGILYTLSKVDQSGFSIDFGSAIIQANLEKVLSLANEAIVPESTFSDGLDGNTGIALLIAELINGGHLERSINNLNLVSELLSMEFHENLSLGSGLAGLGLASMKISRLLNFPNFETIIFRIVNQLTAQQLKNGGWHVSAPTKNKKLVSHGLLDGVAGIAYFLFVFGHEFDHEPSRTSAKRALRYLEKQMIVNGDILHIPQDSRHHEPNPWLESGFSGIAYLFIRAFEYEHVDDYRQIAGKLLENHPESITSNYISQANGVAGVGEIYLEAFRVFKDKTWKDRAKRIGLLLANTFCCSSDDGVYWLDGDDTLPYPGFMNGNAGILHFLARLDSPNTIDFPFIHF